jgi:glyoxylase I family protein
MQIQYVCALLQVFDMNISLQFYCEILGFTVHESAGEKDDMDWVWLKRGSNDLMLNTVYETPDRPPKPDPARVAAHSDTSLYFGCFDVDAAYRELLSKGVKLDPPKTAPYGMKQLYFYDTDGYTLCFQWPDTSN